MLINLFFNERWASNSPCRSSAEKSFIHPRLCSGCSMTADAIGRRRGLAFAPRAIVYMGGLSPLKIRRLRSIFTQYHAPFSPHREIRQVRARYGPVPYFDRRVGFLT